MHQNEQQGKTLMVSVLFTVVTEADSSQNSFIEQLGLKDLIKDTTRSSQEVEPSSLALTEVRITYDLSNIVA